MELEIQTALQGLLETYKFMLEYGDEEFKRPEKFLEHAAKYTRMIDDYRCHANAMACAEHAKTINAFNKEYKDSLLEGVGSRPFELEQSREYLDFQNKLMTIKRNFETAAAALPIQANNADDDLVVEGEENFIDPISKKRMTDPVRNKKCGHRYERTNVVEAIRQHRPYCCPVAGCANKGHMLPDDLEDDLQFRLKLDRMQTSTVDEDVGMESD